MTNNSNDLVKEWYRFSMMDWDAKRDRGFGNRRRKNITQRKNND